MIDGRTTFLNDYKAIFDRKAGMWVRGFVVAEIVPRDMC
jgi:hypothetical protein